MFTPARCLRDCAGEGKETESIVGMGGAESTWRQLMKTITRILSHCHLYRNTVSCFENTNLLEGHNAIGVILKKIQIRTVLDEIPGIIRHSWLLF